MPLVKFNTLKRQACTILGPSEQLIFLFTVRERLFITGSGGGKFRPVFFFKFQHPSRTTKITATLPLSDDIGTGLVTCTHSKSSG